MRFTVPDNFDAGVFTADCLTGGIALVKDDAHPVPDGYFVLQNNTLSVDLDNPTEEKWAVVTNAVESQGGSVA